MSRKTHTYSYVVDRPVNCIRRHVGATTTYYDGTVNTKLGTVVVYAENARGDGSVVLTAYVNGRCYTRRHPRYHRPQYIVTLARRFLEELHA